MRLCYSSKFDVQRRRNQIPFNSSMLLELWGQTTPNTHFRESFSQSAMEHLCYHFPVSSKTNGRSTGELSQNSELEIIQSLAADISMKKPARTGLCPTKPGTHSISLRTVASAWPRVRKTKLWGHWTLWRNTSGKQPYSGVQVQDCPTLVRSQSLAPSGRTGQPSSSGGTWVVDHRGRMILGFSLARCKMLSFWVWGKYVWTHRSTPGSTRVWQ